ncbi:MAG: hypothetical protein Q8P86_03055 [bacterium]|nr:hypothetical protein [bacterium]
MSIISLLSGVVFASLSDGREKARMAGGKSLMAQADHALGYETVMSLAFDEGSGSSVADNAGNNGGTIVGAI